MLKRFLPLGVILALLVSCKAKVPEDVINRETMENVLYDYHLAQSLAKNSKDSVDYRTRLYTESVFRKYKIDEAKFNHSMEWYTRNSEELFRIYKNMDKRYAEARSSTHQIKGNPYASKTSVGDTMNIWTGKDFYLLTTAWNNHIDFQQKADTTFSKGDKLMWQFDTHWYYREGQKNGIAVLALVYENDSVVSSSQNLLSSGKMEVYITVGNKPVKSVEGFVYLSDSWTETPRILTVSDPVLVKFKKREKLQKPVLKMRDVLAQDSTSVEEEIPESTAIEKKEEVQPVNHRILHLPR